MVRARRRTSGRRRRQQVFWDTLTVPGQPVTLPAGSIANLDLIDGAFSSMKRYDQGELLIRRTQLAVDGEITFNTTGGTADLSTVIELCIGVSIFDSMGDVDGLAQNTTIVDGTGPLDDASNSRWYARCCISIPLGIIGAALTTSTENQTIPLRSPRDFVSGWAMLMRRNSTNLDVGFHCEIDSKSMRKLEGIETQFLQLAVQMRTNITPLVGSTYGWAINNVQGRHVLSRRL